MENYSSGPLDMCYYILFNSCALLDVPVPANQSSFALQRFCSFYGLARRLFLTSYNSFCWRHHASSPVCTILSIWQLANPFLTSCYTVSVLCNIVNSYTISSLSTPCSQLQCSNGVSHYVFNPIHPIVPI